MACFPLGDLLPIWFKRYFGIPRPDRSYTSSSRNTSSPEGSGPHASHRSSTNQSILHLSGLINVPPSAYLPVSKSAMDELDEYARWRPQTPPLQPMTKNQPRRKRSVVYSSDLSMLYPSAIYPLLGLVY